MQSPSPPEQQAETVDVLVVGAGISGIGGAYHLRQNHPARSFLILDEQADFGGTWQTHRYPGIRSDSELYTFGYRFKPWRGAPIAAADEILKYLAEVIAENQLAPRIRYRHRILRANWCSTARLWTVEGRRTDSGEPFTVRANFLWMGQGYYRHGQGFTPQWPGTQAFQGEIVHPQRWPESLDLQGRRVVVIGSGATAATLVPALAGRCAHVTMLQRSPTYFFSARNFNELADLLRDLDVPPEWTHEIVRRKLLRDQQALVRRAFEEPEALRRDLLDSVRQHLDSDEMLDKHFSPRYAPWRQRVAYVPNGDLFKAIRSGEASVVTDEIEHFDAAGIRLRSGEHLAADVVVTATGLVLNVMGDIGFSVDGEPVDFARTVTYRGTMFTGVPNLLWVFGYFRASWTLRVDLLGDFLGRLLAHMDARGARQVVPHLRPQDEDMALRPWVEAESFSPGYLTRVMDQMPRQGVHAPWQHTQDFWTDRQDLPQADLDDGALLFR